MKYLTIGIDTHDDLVYVGEFEHLENAKDISYFGGPILILQIGGDDPTKVVYQS